MAAWRGEWNLVAGVVAIGTACLASPVMAASGSWLSDSLGGCQVMNPTPQGGKESVEWFGPCVEGKAHGEGKTAWYNGENLVQVSYGRRNQGVFDAEVGVVIWDNGDSYAGRLQDGLRVGPGAFAWQDGTKFEGEFQNDQPALGVLSGKGFNYEGGFTGGTPVGKVGEQNEQARAAAQRARNFASQGQEVVQRSQSAVEAKLNGLGASGLMLAAGRLERSGSLVRAQKLYERVIDKFPNHEMAMRANDRLLAMGDMEKQKAIARQAEAASSGNGRCSSRYYPGQPVEFDGYLRSKCRTVVIGFSDERGKVSVKFLNDCSTSLLGTSYTAGQIVEFPCQ